MTPSADVPLILLGGGGHSKVVYDAIMASSGSVCGYSAPDTSVWLEELGVPRISSETVTGSFALGFVGLDCDALKHRHMVMQKYRAQGALFPPVIHPSATISPLAKISEGVQVMANAVVNAYAHIAPGCVINSGAIVEHEAHIENGAHIAPGAVVLGAARVGEFAYISSNAVIVQLAQVPAHRFVRALTVYK